MIYKGFYIRITPADDLCRENKLGEQLRCVGFEISIFSDSAMKHELERFTAAVDHELLANDISEAEQLAMDYVDSEEKVFRKMIADMV